MGLPDPLKLKLLNNYKNFSFTCLSYSINSISNGSNFYPFYPTSNFDFLKAIVIVYWSFTGFKIVHYFQRKQKEDNQ